MSKILPDPQIQSLRAMRAGDIAFAQGGTITIGKQSTGVRAPTGDMAISVGPAAPSLEPVSGPFSESPVIGMADMTTLSVDEAANISIATTDALETLAGIFNESPVVGVGFATSVI